MANARGRPEKPVIAIPFEPVAKAGAKIMEFESASAAGRFFGCDKTYINRCIRNNPHHHPYCGFYFDYKLKDD